MATGGEPFRDPLYLTPDGKWLDWDAYLQAVGSPPLEFDPYPTIIETLSPWFAQYTASSGVRVPIPRGRGLSASLTVDGRYRAIGDPLAPAATLFVTGQNAWTGLNPGALVIWLPWPRVWDPQRAQIIAALHAARHHVHLISAGPEWIVNLPGEEVTGAANVLNAAGSPVQVTLQCSISGPSGVTSQPAVPLSLAAGEQRSVPLDMGRLPNGDYTLTTRVQIGEEEVDRIDSPVRVFDPTLTRQPDQKIRAANGSFYAGGRRVFLQGVNYWPRYDVGRTIYQDNWLEPQNYDAELVEADLSLIAALHFNLVNVKYLGSRDSRALIDFLERCRNHGLWVNIALPATLSGEANTGAINPALGSMLEAAYLPGSDRVFAYDLIWEPFVGSHDQGGQCRVMNGQNICNIGRLILDPAWRVWVNDQYGSLASAEQTWGFTAPRDADGQLTNPLDDQMAEDGPWRIMVSAFHRFADDYFGRNLGLIAREIRRTDPDTLLTYRNWTTMTFDHNFQTGYDIGTAAAHLDFVSPENYDGSPTWPDDRRWGLVTAYSRYRTGGKPVHWAEFGYDIGPRYGTVASRAAQATLCDTIMRQVADDGSNAASVWWWPGGAAPFSEQDFGIIDPDGSPRDCALVLSQWSEKFVAAPPDLGAGPPVALTVDRDADSRGEYALFLNTQSSYVSAREAGDPVALVDRGTGTDTASMPLIQIGNAPYAGLGPLKFANAEIGGVGIVCPNLDVTVENGSEVKIPSGAACQITPALVNTGEARWLPAAASKGGVLLHTSLGDVPLNAPVPALQRIGIAPLGFTMGQTASLTGRLRIQGVGDFGETLNITLAVDSTATGFCAISLSSTAPIAAPAGGAKGTMNIITADGCAWKASSPQPWVTVTPGSGVGNGAVNYTIQPNTGPARQTTILVAGHPCTVTEAASSNPALVQAPAMSATSLNFGSQTVGVKSAAQDVKLTNTGAAALNPVSVTIGGANSADFAQTNTCGSAVTAAASCTINITFTPSAPGTRTASLFITGNISGGALAVVLSGTGAATGPVPVIQAIVDSWGYTAGIAPGLWVTIAGTNMAGPPQTWNLKGLQQLPTTLGGVTVNFNDAPAAVFYVSATQINALVPASVAPGPMQVVVQVNGVNSSPFAIAAKATQPAAYAPPNADASTFFVTAALQGTTFLVGNSATDPRVVRAAYPGDVLDLYMLGLGATTDPSKFVTDKAFSGAFPVSAKVTATVGGESAPVLFAGLTSPGLYLVRISIPSDLAAGPQPIEVSAGGDHTRSSLVLMLGTAPPNLIRNGSFELALTDTWTFSVDSGLGAAATIQRTTSANVDAGSSAQVSVTSAATNTVNVAAVQLEQAGFPLQQGQVYRLQFWAKADTARTLRFDVAQNSAVSLGGNWQPYVVYFQATATDPAARLDFYFGDQTGNTWLDAVILEGTSP